ncbi:MAG: hypothetical protein HC767_05295 [Akkermansiaceae bacterium]|nr:hypothetical protein [Akkermansiaceae bacterium]
MYCPTDDFGESTALIADSRVLDSASDGNVADLSTGLQEGTEGIFDECGAQQLLAVAREVIGQTHDSEYGMSGLQTSEHSAQFASYTSQNSQADIARELLEPSESQTQYDADLESGSVALDGVIGGDSSALFENSHSTNLARANANLLAHRTNEPNTAASRGAKPAAGNSGSLGQDAIWRPGLGALDEESDLLSESDALRNVYALSPPVSGNSEMNTQLTSQGTSISESSQLQNLYNEPSAGMSPQRRGGGQWITWSQIFLRSSTGRQVDRAVRYPIRNL